MRSDTSLPVTITVNDTQSVSGLLLLPESVRACYVFAHGAGAGMTHGFMQAVAVELAQRGMGTLRYQFPFMQNGSKRPDAPHLAHATVRAAVQKAAEHVPGMPLFAGGKSFGGRMSSQAHAASPLPGVRGLVFMGFPLHPAGKPAVERARHLTDVRCPMLFVQGTHDKLAEQPLLTSTVRALGPRARLYWIENADHALHVPARSGRTDAEVRGAMLDEMVAWTSAL